MRIIISFILCCFWAINISYANDTSNQTLTKQRILFQQAQKALKTHQLTRFKVLLEQLADYPLQPYLQYQFLQHRLNHLPDEPIANFLSEYPDTFFATRLRSRWLDKLARKKKWQLFLDHYQAPQSITKQCLRLQALLNTGQKEQAMAETVPLWLVPRSQNKACDPAFSSWQKQGLLTDELRWQRINLALQENQFSLAKFLAKPMDNTTEVTAWINRWQKMHHNPLSLLKQLPGKSLPSKGANLFQDLPITREIILHGIERLAKKSTDKAYDNWLRIQSAYQFSEQDKLYIQRTIANRAALRREDRTLEFFGDIPAEPWRVRAALWQQDWPAVKRAILSLNITEQQSSRWQYWLGRSQVELGNSANANIIFQSIFLQRDYYAFLAADKLGRPYQMNHNPIVYEEIELTEFSQRPAVARLKEFYVLDIQLDGRRQAYELKQKLSPRDLQLLAILTHQWNWHHQTIALLGKAQYWDALNLRFPIVYDTAILKAGKKNGLNPSWLFGIARQESAFNPQARSHVGATGLMQLMPKTGKLIARLINKPMKKTSELLNPNRNIQLGSAYLRRMYDKNQQNPVLATASYNAGPHRVAQWLPEHELPADIWLENIPFNETRKYTRSVLSYAAIFDYQRKQKIIPLFDRMPAVQAKTP
ncbi:MAG: transglycosylase [Methylophaga sp.]|nr:MAG: transglycosylase [Methylophaga sp.]